MYLESVGEGARSDGASAVNNSSRKDGNGEMTTTREHRVSWADVVAGNARQQKPEYLVRTNEHQGRAHSLELFS